MTQITWRLHTAVVGTEDCELTTTNVQPLPSWAPPIEYIGDATTGPWLATLVTTTTTSGVAAMLQQVRVFAYGRNSNIRTGSECVALSVPIAKVTATRHNFLTLTYRAVGELTRP